VFLNSSDWSNNIRPCKKATLVLDM